MNASELAKWKARGGRGPKVQTVHGLLPDGFQVLDPAKLAYRAAIQPEGAVDECAGCLFFRQEVSVCDEAARLAVLADLTDCDHLDPETGRQVIYLLRATDPRQLSIIEDEN